MRRLIMALAFAACSPSLAHGQEPQCVGVTDALAGLLQRYQEQPVVTGLTASGTALIITSDAAGGFSVLLVSPDGKACMVTYGSALEVQEPPKPGIDG